MLRFVLGLLYFLRFHFVFLFFKSESCWMSHVELAPHLQNCGGGGVKNVRTWGGYICWGGQYLLPTPITCLGPHWPYLFLTMPNQKKLSINF